MNSKKYLRIENDSFGFVTDGIHEIKETDIEIREEDYNNFFELQSQGKQFRLKTNRIGTALFDYIEEYIPEVVIDNTPTQEDRLAALELAFLEVL